MGTAVLVGRVDRYRPVTNLYACSDGRYLLVTVPDKLLLAPEDLGFGSMTLSDVPEPVAVFLADELGQVLDPDGDLSNGMTPLALFEDVGTHAQALSQLGFVLESPLMPMSVVKEQE